MKKLLGIVVLGLLWTSIGFANDNNYCNKNIDVNVVDVGILRVTFHNKENKAVKIFNGFIFYDQSKSLETSGEISGNFYPEDYFVLQPNEKIEKYIAPGVRIEGEIFNSGVILRCEKIYFGIVEYKPVAIVILLDFGAIIFLLIAINKTKSIKTKTVKSKNRAKSSENIREEKKLAQEERKIYKVESSSDLGARLKRLKKMYNDGHLSKVEFEKAKNKLLK